MSIPPKRSKEELSAQAKSQPRRDGKFAEKPVAKADQSAKDRARMGADAMVSSEPEWYPGEETPDQKKVGEWIRSLPENHRLVWCSDMGPQGGHLEGPYVDVIVDEALDDVGTNCFWTFTVPGDIQDEGDITIPTKPDGSWSVYELNDALDERAAIAGRPDVTFVYDPNESKAIGDTLMAQVNEQIELGTYDMGDGLQVSNQVMDHLLEQDPDEAAAFMEDLKAQIHRLTEED